MIGIDVGARKAHVYDTDTGEHLTLLATQLEQYLTQLAPTVVVLELTGAYGRAVAELAHRAGHTVYLAHDTDSHALRRLLRSPRKSDRLDARLLARLAELSPHLPGPPHLTPYTNIRPLLEVRRLAHTWRYLIRLRAAIRTRNRTPDTEPLPLEEQLTELIEQYQQRTIAAVPEETLRLLTSIPGVSPALAALLYATLGDINRFTRDRAVSYAGVAPRHAPTSGQSTGKIKRRHRYATLLHAHLHTYALRVAANPARYDRIGDTYRRVRTRSDGKRALHAVKRHLIRIVYGVLKSGQPYRARDAQQVTSA
jgi:transposase